MSKSKFTPGPWKIDGGRGRKRELYVWQDLPVGSISCHAIATIHPDLCAVEANARLIAAAPELLEALRELWRVCLLVDARIDVVAAESGPHYTGAAYHSDLKERIKTAMAAIAKAEGE